MAFRFRPVYYNEVKSPFFIVNNTKSVYELSKICMSFFMFMLYGRLLNLLPTVWRLAQWRISEHKTVNTPQKLMRGRMFNEPLHPPLSQTPVSTRFSYISVRKSQLHPM